MSNIRYLRRIEVHLPWWDFPSGVWRALERLGYELVPEQQSAEASDAYIVATDRLSRLSAEGSAPIILIGESQRQGRDDLRVFGVARWPAELLDLYALLQRALEEHPRAVPRIRTSLPARSLREGIDTPGTILSLSEKGCLMRSERGLPGFGSIHLQFRLPDRGLVHTRAGARHQAGNELGLAFEGLPEASRAAIGEFVETTLTQGV